MKLYLCVSINKISDKSKKRASGNLSAVHYLGALWVTNGMCYSIKLLFK